MQNRRSCEDVKAYAVSHPWGELTCKATWIQPVQVGTMWHRGRRVGPLQYLASCFQHVSDPLHCWIRLSFALSAPPTAQRSAAMLRIFSTAWRGFKSLSVAWPVDLLNLLPWPRLLSDVCLCCAPMRGNLVSEAQEIEALSNLILLKRAPTRAKRRIPPFNGRTGDGFPLQQTCPFNLFPLWQWAGP